MTVTPDKHRSSGQRSSLDRVLRALEDAGCQPHKEGPQFAASCCMPGHPDPGPSLKIRWVPNIGAGGGGGVMLHCHGCGDTTNGKDLAEALGLDMADLFDEPLPKREFDGPRTGRTAKQRKSGQRRGKLGRLPKALVPRSTKQREDRGVRHQWREVAVYPYVDADGELVQEVVRKECACDAEDGRRHKRFVQRFYVDGRQTKTAPAEFVPPLYRLPKVLEQVRAGGVVWVLEGEKDVETGERPELGLVASTNTNGGTVFSAANAESLRGARVHVVLDRDRAGWRRGVHVFERLTAVDASVRLFLPATTEAKADFTDHIDAGHDLDALVSVHVDEVRTWAVASEMPNAAEAVAYAVANADAYHERAQAGSNDGDSAKDTRSARRWAKESEIKFETVEARLEEARALTVRTGTEWAGEALELAEGEVVRARARMVRVHEALGLPTPAATVGPALESVPDEPAVEHVGDTGGSGSGGGNVATIEGVGDDEDDDGPGSAAEELVEPADNATNFRILHGRIVQDKRRTSRDGGVDYSSEPILSIAVQVIERELAEHEDEHDDEVAALQGRSSRIGDDVNPRPVVQPIAWTVQYIDPATGERMRLRVDNDSFEKMTWLEGLPGPPDFNRSSTGRKTVQSAIFAVSPPVRDVVRYRSTGWRNSSEGWKFVHAGGVIGVDGNKPAPVMLSGALLRYDLPDPVNDPGQLRAAFYEASGGMMARFPRRIVSPMLGHVWRSAVARIPGACVLTGSPGSKKTALASLVMHHWGELWTNQRPGTSGDDARGDTINAVRKKLHHANNVLFWNDDFAPNNGIERALRHLGAFIKMVGNQEERERSSRDGMELISGSVPRASGLATSELPPRPGGEGRRALRVPLLADDVDLEQVIHLDKPECRHQRAVLMSSFLQWLAHDVETHRTTAHAETARLRDILCRDGVGEEHAATLGCERSGWVLMLQFLTEVGAVTEQERQAILVDADAGLREAAEAAVDPDLAATSGAKVREMLVHALRTGAAFVEDVRTGESPEWPLASELGWQRMPIGIDSQSGESRWRVERRGNGIRLGFVHHTAGGSRQLFAFQESLDQTVTAVAKTLADAPQLDIGTVLRALRDEDLLETAVENGKRRFTLKQTLPCLGQRKRVVVLRLDELLERDDDDPLDDGSPPPREDRPPGSTDGRNDVGPWRPADLFDVAPDPPMDDSGSGVVVGGDDETAEQPAGLTSPVTAEETMTSTERAPVEFTNSAGHTAARHAVPGVETMACVVCGDPSSAMFDSSPMHVLCFKQSTHTSTQAVPAGASPRRDQTHATTPANDQATPVTAPNQRPTKPAVPATAPQAAAVVVDVDGVWFPDGRRIDLPDPLTNAGHVAQLGYDLSLGTKVTSWRTERAQIWVTQGLLAKLGVDIDPQSLPRDVGARERHQPVRDLTAGTAFVDDAVAAGWSIGGDTPALGQWTRMWREDNAKRGVFIVLIPALVTDDETAILPVLAGDPNPTELAARIQLAAGRLGMPYAVSPGATGFDLLKILVAKRRKQLRERHENPAELLVLHDVPEPAKQPTQESDFNWCRTPGEAEAALGYVHLYDRGGSYAAAVAGLEVGIGEADYVGAGASFDPKLPGYWQFVLPEAGDWRYPHPLWPTMRMPAPDKPIWATTPTLQYAAELGYDVEVLQAWVWPEHGRVLDTWQKRLSQARAGLDVDDRDHQLARDMVKAVYTRTIGLMGSSDYMSGKAGFRPDWRHHIIAKARANMLRRVMQIGEDEVWPLAMRTDAIVYASDEPDALQAWPGKPKQLGRGLGQYKPEGTLSMGEYLELLGNRRNKNRYDLDGEFRPPATSIRPKNGDQP